MPKLRGLFDYFPQLDTIPTEKIASWLRQKVDIKILENEFGNKLLYPQSVPMTTDAMLFDLALLRESLRLQPKQFYSQNFKRIYIPEKFLEIFPDLPRMVWAFIDAFEPSGLTTILLKTASVGTKNLGTLIRPEIVSNSGWINIWMEGKKFQVKIGGLMVIPASSKMVDIKFDSQVAKLMGKNTVTAEVAGGSIGLIVDSRTQSILNLSK